MTDPLFIIYRPTKSGLGLQNQQQQTQTQTNLVQRVDPVNGHNKHESKNVHHYFDARATDDISQLNDMSFGEETHSNETVGNMPQINGK